MPKNMTDKIIDTEVEVNMFDHGRVTIPLPIRNKLGLKRGSRFVILIKKILDFESLPGKPRKEKTKKTELELQMEQKQEPVILDNTNRVNYSLKDIEKSSNKEYDEDFLGKKKNLGVDKDGN